MEALKEHFSCPSPSPSATSSDAGDTTHHASSAPFNSVRSATFVMFEEQAARAWVAAAQRAEMLLLQLPATTGPASTSPAAPAVASTAREPAAPASSAPAAAPVSTSGGASTGGTSTSGGAGGASKKEPKKGGGLYPWQVALGASAEVPP